MAQQRTNSIERIRLNAREYERSMRWYRKQVQQLAVSRQQLRNDVRKQSIISTNIEIGKLYLFYYDPKLKDVLPIYDKFPLVFPFNYASGGFLGINLHYLPFGFRFYIIERLNPVLFFDSKGNVQKAKISWNLLNVIAGNGSLNGAVKHYLASHVKSSFMEIRYEDWKTAASLPLEQFITKK